MPYLVSSVQAIVDVVQLAAILTMWECSAKHVIFHRAWLADPHKFAAILLVSSNFWVGEFLFPGVVRHSAGRRHSVDHVDQFDLLRAR